MTRRRHSTQNPCVLLYLGWGMDEPIATDEVLEDFSGSYCPQTLLRLFLASGVKWSINGVYSVTGYNLVKHLGILNVVSKCSGVVRGALYQLHIIRCFQLHRWRLGLVPLLQKEGNVFLCLFNGQMSIQYRKWITSHNCAQRSPALHSHYTALPMRCTIVPIQCTEVPPTIHSCAYPVYNTSHTAHGHSSVWCLPLKRGTHAWWLHIKQATVPFTIEPVNEHATGPPGITGPLTWQSNSGIEQGCPGSWDSLNGGDQGYIFL